MKTQYKMYINWRLTQKELVKYQQVSKVVKIPKWRREELGVFDKKEDAEKYLKEYLFRNNIDRDKYVSTGIHEFYTYSKDEWNSMKNSGLSKDKKTRILYEHVDGNTKVLQEGLHFKIEE